MDKAIAKTYKRKNYFIDKGFQSNFILKFFILVFIGGLLTIGMLYFLSAQSTTVAIVNSRVVARTTADFLLPILIQTVVIITIMVSLATAVVTLLVSHKIAGPMYRFKKVLENLEKGDFSSGFNIRQHDQLQDVADTFNSMIKKTRQELSLLKSGLASLSKELNAISEQEVSEAKRAGLRELKDICEELNRKIGHFKT